VGRGARSASAGSGELGRAVRRISYVALVIGAIEIYAVPATVCC
jgi:hypothetical protein